jgi:hypothetical protein
MYRFSWIFSSEVSSEGARTSANPRMLSQRWAVGEHEPHGSRTVIFRHEGLEVCGGAPGANLFAINFAAVSNRKQVENSPVKIIEDP